MGLFKGQFANVVEWEEYRDDIIFWKWTNREIKKGSKLIIRAGQDAIFMYNGKIEGIFKDEGSFDIESQIIPFLSTLKELKFYSLILRNSQRSGELRILFLFQHRHFQVACQ